MNEKPSGATPPNDDAAPTGVTVPVAVAIACTLIDPNPEQPRQNFDEAGLKELAANIKARGLIQPIVVHPQGDRFVLHDGERRWRAHLLAGLAEIPAYIIPLGADAKELLLRAIAANDQRADLTAIERARSYQRLADEFDLSDSQIAAEVTKSRSLVANTRRLLKLPEERQAQVASGELSERQALALLPLYQYPADVQAKLKEAWNVKDKLAKAHKLTSDQIRQAIKAGLETITTDFRTFQPDEPVSPQQGPVRGFDKCTDCPACLKAGDTYRCADRDCFQAKEYSWMRLMLEQARQVTGLNSVDPGRSLSYQQYTEFYSSRQPILEYALACKCPNLVLRCEQHAYRSQAKPGGVSPFISYICLHPGRGEKSCVCRQAVEADKLAQEAEKKAENRQVRDLAVQAISAALAGAPLPALKAVAMHLASYGERDKAAAADPARLVKQIANDLVERHYGDYNDAQTNRKKLAEWLARLGLALDDPDAVRIIDIDDRLVRIGDWVRRLRAHLPTPEQVRGNLANLAALAGEAQALQDTGSDANRAQLTERKIFAGIDQLKAALLAIQPLIDSPADHTSDVEIEHVPWLVTVPAGDGNFKSSLDQVKSVATLDYSLALLGLHRETKSAIQAIERRRRKIEAANKPTTRLTLSRSEAAAILKPEVLAALDGRESTPEAVPDGREAVQAISRLVSLHFDPQRLQALAIGQQLDVIASLLDTSDGRPSPKYLALKEYRAYLADLFQQIDRPDAEQPAPELVDRWNELADQLDERIKNFKYQPLHLSQAKEATA